MPNVIAFVWRGILSIVRALRSFGAGFRQGAHQVESFTSRLVLETLNVFVAIALVAGASMAAATLVREPADRLIVTCLIAGIAIAIYYMAQRGALAAHWQRLQFRLRQRALLDVVQNTYTVDIKTHSNYAAWNFASQFAAIPARATEVMIRLRQTRKRKWKNREPYTIESLKHQIDELDAQIDAGKIKHAINWVCFTDRDGHFVAYQFMGWFRREMGAGNLEYAKVLCERDQQAFRDRIIGHSWTDLQQKQRKVTAPNTLPELNYIFIPSDLTRREAVIYLVASGFPHAMLVSAEDKKPVAVLTLQSLLNGVFDEDLAPDSERLTLFTRIQKWQQEYWQQRPNQGASLADAMNATEHDDDNPSKEASSAARGNEDEDDDDFRQPQESRQTHVSAV